VLDVRGQERGRDGFTWYFVDVRLGAAGFEGYVREDAVDSDESFPCIDLP
jgi:hypothetical protein